MAGIALHIGLNGVDPNAYEGWDGTLDAGENDAVALEQITQKLRYDTRILLTRKATTKAVLGEISRAATSLSAGDIFVLTYAGHGGQLADLDGDEPDHLDETWVLYDRQLLDDEVRVALSGFPAGVRIVTVSDSCHSGTVTRDAADALMHQRGIAAAYAKAAPRTRGGEHSRSGPVAGPPRIREIPSDVQKRIQAKQAKLYRGIRRSTPRADASTTDASVLLLAACMDNQTSAEQAGHGLFTAALLEQWNGRDFGADYRGVMSAARRLLPPLQSPNLFPTGRDWPGFEDQIAFTLEPPTDAAVTGPQSADTSTTDKETTPVTGSDQPMTLPTDGTAPQLAVAVDVTLRPADRVSEMLLNLLAASTQEAQGTQGAGRRDLATLYIDTLSCGTSDDFGGDEPYITFNGEKVWSATGVDSGDSRVVGYRRAFSDSVIIELYDEELTADDKIGSRVITSDETGLGTRTAYFSGAGGARYTLTYSVD